MFYVSGVLELSGETRDLETGNVGTGSQRGAPACVVSAACPERTR